jgi:hypothetical protein
MILEVTSRQFRNKQKTFFDLADNGKRIVIKRGHKQSYELTPVVDEDDTYFSSETIEKIDLAMEQFKTEKYSVFKSKDELHKFLDHL